MPSQINNLLLDFQVDFYPSVEDLHKLIKETIENTIDVKFGKVYSRESANSR
jgi:hypothetical protein